MAKRAPRLATDPVTLWPSICECLRGKIPQQSYLTWFEPVKPVFSDDYRLTIQVPSRFHFDWIESHYGNILRQAISEITGKDYAVFYSYEEESGSEEKLKAAPVSRTELLRREREPFETHLNPRFTFSNFIEGECNRFARTAAITLAQSPGQTPFNPLLIWGGSGLGKTHLVQAIGNLICSRGIFDRVLYITGKEFTENFVQALQTGRMDVFSRLYKSIDVLILDDVQFFLTRDRTQEEFFHTFNALYQSRKQLVFSSDRSPRELEGFDERLASRLQWGLVTELKNPEYETREAILRTLALENNLNLPDDVTQFLAINITENIRNLHGALIHIIGQSSLLKKPVTLEIAKSAIRDMIKRPMRKVSIERIQEIVASEMGISPDDLRSKTRKKDVAEARQIAMYLCIVFTNNTLKTIGLQFGGRDHATVIHARNTIEERIKDSPNTSQLIEKLKRTIEMASL